MALPPRSQRSIEVADHLWSLLETMSREMSTDVTALVNQALFALARQHGYLSPGSVVPPPSAGVMPTMNLLQPVPGAAPSAPTIVPRSMPAAGVTGAMEQLRPPPSAPTPLPAPPPPSQPERSEKSRPGRNKPSVPKNKAPVAPPPAPPPPPAPGPELDYLPGEISGSQPRIEGMISEVLDDTRRPQKGATRKLFIFAENKEATEVTPGRFVLGRDQVCNMTLLSSRISRQHAVVTRDGPTFFIEDLGSSNGTWFNGERITKRPVSDGEKYTLGDIVIQFAFR